MDRRSSIHFGPAVKSAASDLFKTTCFVLFVPLCGYLDPDAKFEILKCRRSITLAPVKLLFIADIVGEPGRRAVKQLVPQLRQRHALDLVMANGENSAGGSGITPKTAEEIFSAGVDIITSGDHLWDQKEVVSLLENEKRFLRPLNYPPGTPGQVSAVIGTLTHVQTADEQIFPAGTAFLCDAGFTGPHESVLGREIEPVIRRFLTGQPQRFEVAKGWVLLQGVVIDIDDVSGKTI